MRLFKTPRSPHYQADIIHPGTGKRTRFSTGETTKGAASEAALSHFHALKQEVEASARLGGRPITLGMALGGYQSALEASKKTSAPMVAGLIRRLLGASQGRYGASTDPRWSLDSALLLQDLTPAHLAALVSARSAEGSGAQTIAHELKVLRAATLRAGELGYGVPKITDWQLPELPKKTRHLSKEEYDRVYDHLDPDRPIVARAGGAAYRATGQRYRDRQDVQDMLVCLAMTGGRWQEIARLTWAQVDLSGRVITLYGDKTDQDRLVPMPDQAWLVLTRRNAASKPDGASPVFPGAGGGFRGPGSCQPILRAMEAVGLNDPENVRRHGRATVHSLRHTFASMLLAGGADLAEVQNALGHATLHMTMRYTHLSKRKSAAKLGSILSRVTS